MSSTEESSSLPENLINMKVPQTLSSVDNDLHQSELSDITSNVIMKDESPDTINVVDHDTRSETSSSPPSLSRENAVRAKTLLYGERSESGHVISVSEGTDVDGNNLSEVKISPTTISNNHHAIESNEDERKPEEDHDALTDSTAPTTTATKPTSKNLLNEISMLMRPKSPSKISASKSTSEPDAQTNKSLIASLPPSNDQEIRNIVEDSDDDEDPVVKQARAIALNASKLLKTKSAPLTPEEILFFAAGGQPDLKQQQLIKEKFGTSIASGGDQSNTAGGHGNALSQHWVNFLKASQQQQQQQPQQSQNHPKFDAKEKFDAFLKSLNLNVPKDGMANQNSGVSLNTVSTDKEISHITPTNHIRNDSNTTIFVPDESSPSRERLESSSTTVSNESNQKSPSKQNNFADMTAPSTHSSTTAPDVPLLSKDNKSFDINSDQSNQSVNHESLVKPTLSTIAWKRRSGYGKYSYRNAWERRKIELVGDVIMYFKCLDKECSTDLQSSTTETNTDTQQQPEDLSTPPLTQSNNPTTVSPSLPSAHQASNMKPKKDFRQFWEDAQQKIQKATFFELNSIPGLGTSNSSTNASSSQNANVHVNHPSGPRGMLDLVKEHATVAASSDNSTSSNEKHVFAATSGSVSPTPFGITIMVKNEAKWKLCFDTHKDQIMWLSALNDIVVRRSVDAYNLGLVQSRSGEEPSQGRFTSFGGSKVETNEGHQSPPGESDGLWKIDRQVSFMNRFEKEENISTLNDMKSATKLKVLDSNNVDISTYDVTSTSVTLVKGLVQSGSISGPVWSLNGNNLLSVVLFMNFSLFYVRCSSTTAREFWFNIVFLNFLIWILILEDKNRIPNELQKDSFKKDHNFLQLSMKRFKSLRSSGSQLPSSKETAMVGHSTIEQNLKISKETTNLQSAYKPDAGSTTVYIEDVDSFPDKCLVNNHRFNSWTLLSPSEILVRSHGYLKTKTKIPSPNALYDLVAVDAISSDLRVANIASRVDLSNLFLKESDSHTKKKLWNSPEIFIVSMAIPTEKPSLVNHTMDGFGLNVTCYYRMKTETREILKKIHTPGYENSTDTSEASLDIQARLTNGVRLWEDWCTRAPSDPQMQARFKYIPNIHNPKDVGLPQYMTKYCGKPVLIKRAGVTGFLTSFPDLNVMEFDVSLHPFPYLAKQATAYLKDHIFKKGLISFSYVIEGRCDEELPELVIGDGAIMVYPDSDLAINADDLFAGVAPTSLQDEKK